MNKFSFYIESFEAFAITNKNDNFIRDLRTASVDFQLHFTKEAAICNELISAFLMSHGVINGIHIRFIDKKDAHITEPIKRIFSYNVDFFRDIQYRKSQPFYSCNPENISDFINEHLLFPSSFRETYTLDKNWTWEAVSFPILEKEATCIIWDKYIFAYPCTEKKIAENLIDMLKCALQNNTHRLNLTILFDTKHCDSITVDELFQIIKLKTQKVLPKKSKLNLTILGYSGAMRDLEGSHDRFAVFNNFTVNPDSSFTWIGGGGIAANKVDIISHFNKKSSTDWIEKKLIAINEKMEKHSSGSYNCFDESKCFSTVKGNIIERGLVFN